MKKIDFVTRRSLKWYVPAMASLFSLLLVAAVPSLSEARGPRGEGPYEERMLGHLQYRLNLTPEQMEKIRPVVEEENAKMKAMKTEHHKKMRELRDEFRKEMKTNRDRMGERIGESLTPEQKEEYRKMKEERDAWQKERMENRGKGKNKGNFEGKGKRGPAGKQ